MRGEDRLLELQETDLAIGRLESRRGQLQSGAAVTEAREAADAAETTVGEIRLAIDAENREQRRLERDIDTIRQKSAAEEKRMYDGSIVNQKELEALQHEISNLRGRKDRFEDEVLERMERVEGLQARLADAERSLAEAKARRDSVEGETTSELAGIEAQLVDRRASRDKLLPELDPELLELYEELRESKHGVGAAELVDGVCQGCHQTLSAVERDRLKRADVKRCEYCRRILVFG